MSGTLRPAASRPGREKEASEPASESAETVQQQGARKAQPARRPAPNGQLVCGERRRGVVRFPLDSSQSFVSRENMAVSQASQRDVTAARGRPRGGLGAIDLTETLSPHIRVRGTW